MLSSGEKWVWVRNALGLTEHSWVPPSHLVACQKLHVTLLHSCVCTHTHRGEFSLTSCRALLQNFHPLPCQEENILMLYSQNTFGPFPFERYACLHRQFRGEFIKPCFAWICECLHGLKMKWRWRRRCFGMHAFCTSPLNNSDMFSKEDVFPVHWRPRLYHLRISSASKQHWVNSWGFCQLSVSSTWIFPLERSLSSCFNSCCLVPAENLSPSSVPSLNLW